VPQRSVSELQGLQRVFVVGADNQVEERPVVVGPALGSDWLIREGLGPGEHVIYEGLQKVADGAMVRPKVVTPETPAEEKQ
jgi:membrane fusion protein (multidrug efflux system)